MQAWGSVSLDGFVGELALYQNELFADVIHHIQGSLILGSLILGFSYLRTQPLCMTDYAATTSPRNTVGRLVSNNLGLIFLGI